MLHGAEHVIVAPVDDAADGWIRDVRSRFDPIAASIPAHFTLVYPFAADIEPGELGKHMTTALAAFHPFPVTLAGVSGSEGSYLRYDIKEGNDILIAMHDQLYAGPLERHLDLSQSFQPHLTLGRIDDPTRWRAALCELSTTAPRITITVRRVISYRRHADGTRLIDNTVQL
jgi:2'-5' RNA ligase